ncbi:IS3 family transposase [Alteribacillus persepolensis]|uniref:IS3 family transposase n=1 Tax=Alteribacillus persepolensis TaxID=568899 RepID=UPI000B8262F3
MEIYSTQHLTESPKSLNSIAHIEAFHRLLEDECFQRFEFKTYEEAYREVASYIAFYNERRLHGSVLDLSPKEYYNQTKRGLIPQREVRV